jgi:hypothetical protein
LLLEPSIEVRLAIEAGAVERSARTKNAVKMQQFEDPFSVALGDDGICYPANAMAAT